MGRLFAFVLGWVALVAGPGSPTAAGSPTQGAAGARDSFHGTISGGTGAYRHAEGRLALTLHAPGAVSSRRAMTLTLAGGSCSGCLRISGVLGGYIQPGPRRTPDTGSSFRLAAAGRLRGVGPTSASGTAVGTGFTARGYETVQLTLRMARGTITVSARSGQVSGFSSP